MLKHQPDGSWFIERFDTVDGTWFRHMRFPVRLLRFAALLHSGFHLCHINVASRLSTVRKTMLANLCRRCRIPYIVHLHGGGYPGFYAGLPGCLRETVRSFFGDAERVIVLGQLWRDFVVQDLRVRAERVVILPNAVPGPAALDQRRSDGVPRVLFLGNLSAPKGIDQILESLVDTRLLALPWFATLAGGGNVTAVRQRITKCGLANRVDVPGWVRPVEVERLLSTSDVLLLPSRVENLPLSVLEGMAYGLCIVATPVGAVPEVIHDGENGILTPVGDAESLAVNLTRVLGDPRLRTHLGDAARASYERCYDIRTYRARLEAIYSEAVASVS